MPSAGSVTASRLGFPALVHSAQVASAPAPCILTAACLPTPQSQAASTLLALVASALAAPLPIWPPAHGPLPIDSWAAAYAARRGLLAL
jgi:hypothetical protein